MAYWQQGDVLIKELPARIDDRPWRLRDIEERKTKELDELVVAYGEATGHSHKIVGKIVNYIPDYHRDEIVFELVEPAIIYHEEHGEVELPAGKYFIEQVREFDHFMEESRAVRD